FRSAPVVAGPAPDLAAWLIGRGGADLLTVTPEGPVPNPPEWM
ncbi:maleylpyruvate isomerase, partial [Micromonospora azadirachtae]